MKKQSERPSDLDILRFRQECFNFIKEIFGKILERSPLKFKLITRSISCFSPHIIQLKLAISRIKSLLNIFVDNRRMSSNSAEQCRKQFSELCRLASSDLLESFEGWSEKTDRLDHFFASICLFQYKHFTCFRLDWKIFIVS